MNKINQLFKDSQDKKLLSLYFCAGCPTLENTGDVIKTMQRRGIAMIEVGIPFSDPLADGPVIQSAATRAIKNGMSLKKLFAQLQEIKDNGIEVVEDPDVDSFREAVQVVYDAYPQYADYIARIQAELAE